MDGDSGSDDESAQAFATLLASCSKYPGGQSCEDNVENEDDANVAFLRQEPDASLLTVDAEHVEGECVDSGTQLSEFGEPQAKAFQSEFGIFPKMRKSSRAFRLADVHHRGLGLLRINMPVSDSLSLEFDAEIVNVNVPLLLGLDTLS